MVAWPSHGPKRLGPIGRPERSGRRGLSLRSRLFLPVVVCVVPLAGFRLVELYLGYRGDLADGALGRPFAGPAWGQAAGMLAASAAVLALGLALAAYAARRIAGPIETLRGLAGRGEGDAPPEPPPTGLQEVDEVAAALHAAELERRQSQQTLRRSEERFRTVVESAPNAIVMIDARGRIDMVNAQTERIFGYERAELVGQPVDMLVPGRFSRHHPAMREDYLAAPRTRPMGAGRDLYALGKGGREFPVEIGLSPIETAAGPMVLASIIDITQRKAAERDLLAAQDRAQQSLAALRRSEEQLKRAQRLARMGSFAVDLRTDGAELSDEAYRILGVAPQSFDGRAASFLERVHPEDRAGIRDGHEGARRGKAPAPFEFRIVRPDGAVRQVYHDSELILDESGAPLCLAGMLHDVTEHRQVEQQLRQAQKMEAIGTITGGMAHDFNNLLGVVIGNLDLARDRLGGDAELGEMVGEALEAALSGADLTRRLLAFARRQPLRPERIDVNALIGNTVKLLRRVLGEDIDISLALGEDVAPIVADPAQLEASLANLATNARDAMPKGGRLMIATANRRLDADYVALNAEAREGDFAMIEVSDTGLGMSAEIRRRIFEPFFTTKEPGKGTGLGLSMVFGFMRQSGGHIAVYSEPGVGTTFRLYLPVAPEAAPSREAVEARPAQHGAGETILVVEDNPAVRRVVLRQLRELRYRALECARGAEALELLERERVDLLFSDIVMPGGLDGVELVRRARERWPALKIMLTSGFPQARLDAIGESASGIQLLSKPYRKEELAAMLRAVLDG